MKNYVLPFLAVLFTISGQACSGNRVSVPDNWTDEQIMSASATTSTSSQVTGGTGYSSKGGGAFYPSAECPTPGCKPTKPVTKTIMEPEVVINRITPVKVVYTNQYSVERRSTVVSDSGPARTPTFMNVIAANNRTYVQQGKSANISVCTPSNPCKSVSRPTPRPAPTYSAPPQNRVVYVQRPTQTSRSCPPPTRTICPQPQRRVVSRPAPTQRTVCPPSQSQRRVVYVPHQTTSRSCPPGYRPTSSGSYRGSSGSDSYANLYR